MRGLRLTILLALNPHIRGKLCQLYRGILRFLTSLPPVALLVRNNMFSNSLWQDNNLKVTTVPFRILSGKTFKKTVYLFIFGAGGLGDSSFGPLQMHVYFRSRLSWPILLKKQINMCTFTFGGLN